MQIHDIGEHEGRPFLALEYVAGGSLADRLRREPLPVRAAAQFVETLAGAVHYAHEHGVIHRDLKPANVLLQSASSPQRHKEHKENTESSLCSLCLCGELAPKIADFGLAKQLDAASGPTATSEVMGTPSYMAPEQAAGKSRGTGPATDVYALGAILYEMLTGRPPFRAETPLETLHQVVHAAPVSLHRLRTNVPRDLEIICLKCLEKEPSKRYGSAAALAEDLHRFRNGEPIRARAARPWEKAWKWARRRPAWAALLLVSTLAVLGFSLGGALYTVWLREALARAAMPARVSNGITWAGSAGAPAKKFCAAIRVRFTRRPSRRTAKRWRAPARTAPCGSGTARRGNSGQSSPAMRAACSGWPSRRMGRSGAPARIRRCVVGPAGAWAVRRGSWSFRPCPAAWPWPRTDGCWRPPCRAA